jgi:hypothetical protein
MPPHRQCLYVGSNLKIPDMKIALIATIIFLTSSFSYGQFFEGKLTFKIEFDIKSQKIGEFEITKEKVIEKMRSDGEYFDTIIINLKEGNYIKKDNSSSERIIIYKSDLNKIFSFQKDSEYEIITDASKYNAFDINNKEPQITKIDSIKIINGIKCNLIQLSWDKLGKEYYFYNSDIAKIDSKLFKKHNYEYFNAVVKETNSYPIEIVKTVNNFVSMKMTLVSISEEKVSEEIFDIEKIKSQKTSHSQNKSTNWSSFKDDKIGYTVEYPEIWIPQGGKGGFMCGLKSGFGNSEFTIWWSEVNDSERIDMLFKDDGLYEGYHKIEKPILINGLNGVYYLRTHKKKPNEYHESVVFKTKSTWYKISNSGVKNDWFEHFYQSFKLIK